MKILYTISAILLFTTWSLSQSSVEINGADDNINYASDTAYVVGDGDGVGFIFKKFYVVNTGNTTNFFYSRSILSKSNSSLQIQLCDETQCFSTGNDPYWIIDDSFEKTIQPGDSLEIKPQMTFGMSDGNAKIKYYVLDGNKNKIDSVTVFFTSTLSTLKQEKLAFNIFPNPAQDVVTLKGEAFKKGGEIVFLDALGKEVKRTKIMNANNQINISSLKKGVYFVNILHKDGEKSAVQRLIKQ
ncbi:hypothetical protein CW751_02100 [Brumimicrobium salinarum]|uniref:Secretion system C-terminal sorting domain-containing protein n=1 Tax=Brumimicrobium salinarum TaxID=2058658 RepID=A0A2I0R6D6_9FLAO|nr:T9SS type A sorting domain-containing protein [Brumimicrobium salinarum]PKR82152.1 hypothetical protein CW751_02100 [Brumimicrobium salinarum]